MKAIEETTNLSIFIRITSFSYPLFIVYVQRTAPVHFWQKSCHLTTRKPTLAKTMAISFTQQQLLPFVFVLCSTQSGNPAQYSWASI